MLERILFIIAGLVAGLLLAQSPSLGGTPPTQTGFPRTQTAPRTTATTSLTHIPASGTVPVLNVHDGDTITVLKEGQNVKVRLIGMNAPEIYNYQKTPQCFGTEATQHARILLKNLPVRIETDPSQDTYDKYGRLLAYAFLPDGTNFAEHMIAEGYAHEYTYRLPYQYQKEFKSAEREAQSEGLGLWKSGVCTP